MVLVWIFGEEMSSYICDLAINTLENAKIGKMSTMSPPNSWEMSFLEANINFAAEILGYVGGVNCSRINGVATHCKLTFNGPNMTNADYDQFIHLFTCLKNAIRKDDRLCQRLNAESNFFKHYSIIAPSENSPHGLLSKLSIFSQLDVSEQNGYPNTPLQTSLIKGFSGF